MASDWSLGSVAERAYNRLNDVPTTISGTVMQNYAEESLLKLQNYFETTITTTAIPDTYKTILVDMTCAYALARMAQVGIDFDASIGDFSVSKGNSSNFDNRIDFYVQSAEKGIDAVGKVKSRFYQAFF